LHRDAIRQLEEAVAEVFAVMLNLACTCESVPASLFPAPCLSASVQFSGTLSGRCTLYLAAPTAAELTSNLTGIPMREIPAELCADTAGELCNMIAGSWKTRQPDALAACHLSCPTIRDACEMENGFMNSVTLLCRFSMHSMMLELGLQ
jgi:chemotaxis protein CheX